MRGKVLMLCVALLSCLLMAQTAEAKKEKQKKNRSPFGEVYSMPCGDFMDTDDLFAAVGIYRGSANEKGEVHRNAIANAQAIIREKYKHSYNGMISDYSSTMSSGGKSNIATKLERAGDAALNVVLDHAKEVCVKYSEVSDDDKVECYVAIQIIKTELAKEAAKKVADVLTDEEKERINFDEYNYRKRMEEKMANN